MFSGRSIKSYLEDRKIRAATNQSDDKNAAHS